MQCRKHEEPEIITKTKSRWIGIRVIDSRSIFNQDNEKLGIYKNDCAFCVDAKLQCDDCLVTKTFAHRRMFGSMKKVQYPCMVLMNRIRKSKNPKGLFHSYMQQIENKIKQDEDLCQYRRQEP